MPYNSIPTADVLKFRGNMPRPGGRGQGQIMGGPASGGGPGLGRPPGPPMPPSHGGAPPNPSGPPAIVPPQMGPPQFGGSGMGTINPGMGRPGGGGWPGPAPGGQTTIQPAPQPGPPPQSGGGRASPMTMPDGSTVWIWQGKVYPYDPTGGMQMGPGMMEDTSPQTPQNPAVQ